MKAPMSLDRAIMAFAGVMVLVSVALTQLVSPWWWILTAGASTRAESNQGC